MDLGLTERRFWLESGAYHRILAGPESVRSVIADIHTNPILRGLAEKSTDWRWSSARWYAGDRSVELAIDDPSLPMD